MICNNCAGVSAKIVNQGDRLREIPRDCTECMAEKMMNAGTLSEKSAFTFCDCFKSGHITKVSKQLEDVTEINTRNQEIKTAKRTDTPRGRALTIKNVHANIDIARLQALGYTVKEAQEMLYPDQRIETDVNKQTSLLTTTTTTTTNNKKEEEEESVDVDELGEEIEDE